MMPFPAVGMNVDRRAYSAASVIGWGRLRLVMRMQLLSQLLTDRTL